MVKIVVETANQNLDSELKRLLRENALEGEISVKFEREPNFINGSKVEGSTVIPVCAKDLDSNRIVAIAIRSLKECYVNNELCLMGYLSSLRIDRAYRNGTVLSRFFKYLRKLHNESGCKWDIMMITNGNVSAKQYLTSNRARLPKAHYLGQFSTLAIGLTKCSFKRTYPIPSIRKLKRDEIDQWLNFINHTAPYQRNLYPFYQLSDVTQDDGLLRGLNPENIYVASNGDKIIGTVGIWDQCDYKQSYIERYGWKTRSSRHIYNLYAGITGKPLLPKPGTKLKYVSLAAVCIVNDDKDIFRGLLNLVLIDLNKSKKHQYLLAGFHESDPLLSVAKAYPNVEYKSTAYLTGWDIEENIVNSLTCSKLYFELGSM